TGTLVNFDMRGGTYTLGAGSFMTPSAKMFSNNAGDGFYQTGGTASFGTLTLGSGDNFGNSSGGTYSFTGGTLPGDNLILLSGVTSTFTIAAGNAVSSISGTIAAGAEADRPFSSIERVVLNNPGSAWVLSGDLGLCLPVVGQTNVSRVFLSVGAGT